MSPELENKFDIVFFKGVYYHLKNPLFAFKKIFHVLKQGGVIYFEGTILDFANNVDAFWKDKDEALSKLSSLPVTYFAQDKYGKFNDPSCWFIPTKRCLHDWLKATGYIRIRIQAVEKKSRAFGNAIKDANFKDFENFKI
jgi:SAM-dependent methyltransferase